MGTQALTHQMIARESAKMLVEKNNVVTSINTTRSKEFGEEINGYKKGDTVKIMVPPMPVSFSGANFAGDRFANAPLVSETYVNLVVDQQYHVPLTFTAKEKKLDLTDFSKRFLSPAMNSLSSKVNAYLLKSMYLQTPNVVGTWGTIPGTRPPWRAAASVLDNHLAPEADRCAHFSTDANDALAETNVTLFHTSDEIRGEFSKNAVGMFAGLEFYKQLALPTHTNGPGSGLVVAGTGNQGATLAIDDTKGDTRTALVVLSKGTIFTLAGVFETHPITGEATTRLRQFLVTTDYRRGEYGVTIYPSIVLTSATTIGTVTALPKDRTALTIVGAPSTAAVQNLVFHEDAFATAFVPLPVLANCDGYTATVKGISVRVMSFGDGKADVEHTRIDVLFGTPVAVRPDHACRVTQ
ncbi:P22 phage major capsid protein family protein [Xylella fastidiosa]|uniref:P22 phage major capsid protein family protein n=1 Tax=Xylella fastidiosa TaxID=2371 RepID=UPI000707499D|nr:P22 phage major capsid protein family protein [Xylella fastidiosa]KQH73610.1 hypothetical protein AOT81_07350 [Xylella fastidiosa]WNY20074.1 P22 phage major capsid protein family protein [Xylella fastidiosa]WNY22368.1 P22 phage major capsid protein family protein [Xylella fastidiosa]